MILYTGNKYSISQKSGQKLVVINNPLTECIPNLEMLFDKEVILFKSVAGSDSLNYIYFPTFITDDLFQSKDMKVQTFAKKFIEAYGIPKLEGKMDSLRLERLGKDSGTQSNYHYTGSNYEVVIYGESSFYPSVSKDLAFLGGKDPTVPEAKAILIQGFAASKNTFN